MKTYWLEGRDGRQPLDRILSPLLIENQEQQINDANIINSNPPDRKGVYSPVTFQDIARRSIAGSPVKSGSVGRGTIYQLRNVTFG